jgi:hypothetical protein
MSDVFIFCCELVKYSVKFLLIVPKPQKRLRAQRDRGIFEKNSEELCAFELSLYRRLVFKL